MQVLLYPSITGGEVRFASLLAWRYAYCEMLEPTSNATPTPSNSSTPHTEPALPAHTWRWGHFLLIFRREVTGVLRNIGADLHRHPDTFIFLLVPCRTCFTGLTWRWGFVLLNCPHRGRFLRIGAADHQSHPYILKFLHAPCMTSYTLMIAKHYRNLSVR